MPAVLLESAVLLALILANGVLAMSEIAILSARATWLRQRAERGDHRARLALELGAQPERFLSAVQIGITLVGILAGAFGGATLAEELAGWLRGWPLVADYAEPLAVLVVVLVVTYLSLVLGELAPKQIALANPERTASRLAPLVSAIVRATEPVVRLLAASTRLVLALLGVRPGGESGVTPEELRALVAHGGHLGVFGVEQQAVLDRAIRLGERRVSSLMTPRHEIEWLDLSAPRAAQEQAVAAAAHTHLVVARGSLDEVVGVVNARDLLAQALAGAPFEPAAVARQPLFLPESVPAFDMLARLRAAGQRVALVLDEFGDLRGLVSVGDLADALVGEDPGWPAAEGPAALRRDDGSWLVDGTWPVAELKELLGIASLPEEGHYDTVAGLCLTLAGRIPDPGDRLDWGAWRLEVVDMDGRRVDKVIVWPAGEPPRPPAPARGATGP